jgi:hypothetical protein
LIKIKKIDKLIIMGKKLPIPVDPFTLKLPREVIDCNVADCIKDYYSPYSGEISIPDNLKDFLKNNSEYERGREWEVDLLEQLTSGEIPLHIVEKWTSIYKAPYFRGHLIVWLRKQTEQTEQTE